MDTTNHNAQRPQPEAINIPSRDYFRLPERFRSVDDGLKVLACVRGKEIFVPVRLVGQP